MKRWSTSQGQNAARTRDSCRETTNEARDLREVQKAEAQYFLRITLFNWSPMGTMQRVLEHDIGMHDVFVVVEHRQLGDEQESSIKLDKKGNKVAADEAR